MPNPKIIEYNLTDEICSYGCQQKAKFAFRNGKFCCCEPSNKCVAVREKSSSGLQKAHSEGKFATIDRSISGTKISDTLKQFHQTRMNEVSFEQGSIAVKRKRIFDEQNGACLWCSLTHWKDLQIMLEIDHINGDHSDNSRHNLRLLCPNCHSQTTTWRRRK
jgi:hypothetical protein